MRAFAACSNFSFGYFFCIKAKGTATFAKLFIEKRRSDDAGWQMYNLSEVDIFRGRTRFLPDDSCRWHERKGEMEKRAKDFSPLREIGMWTRFLPIGSDLKA